VTSIISVRNYAPIVSVMVLWYGDVAGNTVEENSKIFSQIHMH